MTIGKNSRKSSMRSSVRAPKFLDKSSGFYGRLDDPEAPAGVEERWNGEGGVQSSQRLSTANMSWVDEKGKAEDFTEGLMGDDGESLLQRKPSRRSSRWRRSSRRKQKEQEDAAKWDAEVQTETALTPEVVQVETVDRRARGMKEPTLVHFAAREDADDHVLIRDKKRGRDQEDEEEEEERRMKREQQEGLKMVKRNTVKNYRKVSETRRRVHTFMSFCFRYFHICINSTLQMTW